VTPTDIAFRVHCKLRIAPFSATEGRLNVAAAFPILDWNSFPIEQSLDIKVFRKRRNFYYSLHICDCKHFWHESSTMCNSNGFNRNKPRKFIICPRCCVS